MSIEEQNKAIARRYYTEIMSGGNLAVIDELLHPDFLFTLATRLDPYRGPEAFKESVSMLHRAFPDIHVQTEHLLAQGDTVVGHWTAAGTHMGGPLMTVFGEIPPTGKSFRIDGMTWLTIKDGKILESLATEDTVGMLTQLGILPSAEPAPVTTTAEQNAALVGRYFNELMNERKLDVIEEIMSPDVTFRIATLPEPIRGHAGMRRFVSGLVNGFPDMKFTMERRIADGDRVAARWVITGTHNGPFLGFPPSGNTIKDQGIDIFVFQHGKIAEVWVNENDLGLLQQMGVVPKG